MSSRCHDTVLPVAHDLSWPDIGASARHHTTRTGPPAGVTGQRRKPSRRREGNDTSGRRGVVLRSPVCAEIYSAIHLA